MADNMANQENRNFLGIRFTRRDLLKAAVKTGLAAGAASFLEACASPQTVQFAEKATTQPTSTVNPPEKQPVVPTQPATRVAGKTAIIPEAAPVTPVPDYWGELTPQEQPIKQAVDTLSTMRYGVKGSLLRNSEKGLGTIFEVREVLPAGKKLELNEMQLGYLKFKISEPLNSEIAFKPLTIEGNNGEVLTATRKEFVGETDTDKQSSGIIERIVYVDSNGDTRFYTDPDTNAVSAVGIGGITPEINDEMSKVQEKLPSGLEPVLEDHPGQGYLIAILDKEGNKVAYWNGQKGRFEEVVVIESESGANLRSKPEVSDATKERLAKKGEKLTITGKLTLEDGHTWYTVTAENTPVTIPTPVPTATPKVAVTPSVTEVVTPETTVEVKEEPEKLSFIRDDAAPRLSKDQLALLKEWKLEDLPESSRPEPTATKEAPSVQDVYISEKYRDFGGVDLKGLKLPQGNYVLKEGGADKVFDAILETFALQKGIDQATFLNQIRQGNGKIEVLMPVSELITGSVSTIGVKKETLDLSKPAVIRLNVRPPNLEPGMAVYGLGATQTAWGKGDYWYGSGIVDGQLTFLVNRDSIEYYLKDPEKMPHATQAGPLMDTSIELWVLSQLTKMLPESERTPSDQRLIIKVINNISSPQPDLTGFPDIYGFFFGGKTKNDPQAVIAEASIMQFKWNK